MLDSPLYQNFVHPLTCRQLVRKRMLVPGPFFWEHKKEDAYLRTTHFDVDNYYGAAYEVFSIFNPIVSPAYTTKDMEVLLPTSYCLQYIDGIYELSCPTLFHLHVEKHERMPDVFANMVMKALDEQRLTAAAAILKLKSLKSQTIHGR